VLEVAAGLAAMAGVAQGHHLMVLLGGLVAMVEREVES
jgi:hypothetical protein